jgi:hypothetical protein
MFAVIYRWKLVPGREAMFEDGWRAGTDAIAREFGGWGSPRWQQLSAAPFSYVRLLTRPTKYDALRTISQLGEALEGEGDLVEPHGAAIASRRLRLEAEGRGGRA